MHASDLTLSRSEKNFGKRGYHLPGLHVDYNELFSRQVSNQLNLFGQSRDNSEQYQQRA